MRSSQKPKHPQDGGEGVLHASSSSDNGDNGDNGDKRLPNQHLLFHLA
jgi:hypothetical protein